MLLPHHQTLPVARVVGGVVVSENVQDMGICWLGGSITWGTAIAPGLLSLDSQSILDAFLRS